MTPTRKRRLIGVLVIIIGVSISAVVAMQALNENMLFFVSPTDVEDQNLPEGKRFRLGGLVKPGTVEGPDERLATNFTVTDGPADMDVVYVGILPDLFREGQGIVAHGQLQQDQLFVAEEVLAKHDENYMPPEVADALKATHDAAVGNTTKQVN